MQKRGAAIVAAGCILLAHLISLRHETTVAHVRDSAGVLEHAHALSEYHEDSTTPHLHGSDADDHADIGPCALLAGLEQSTILAHAPVVAASIAAHATSVALVPPAAVAGIAVLAFAPKTSPPSIG
jgi:hypothetical protein